MTRKSEESGVLSCIKICYLFHFDLIASSNLLIVHVFEMKSRERKRFDDGEEIEAQ